jgi:hypothetical protein
MGMGMGSSKLPIPIKKPVWARKISITAGLKTDIRKLINQQESIVQYDQVLIHVSSGIACDIPSVIYQYIWEPAVWSKYYSEGPEILKYFKDTAAKYGLNRYINLRHRVDHAQWLDQEGKWRVTITNLQNGKTLYDEGEVLINATGFLKYVGIKLGLWQSIRLH